MHNQNPSLLPHILKILSKKTGLFDTYENLCEEIKDILLRENLQRKYKNTRDAIENALYAGQNLGILTLTGDRIRLFSNYNKDFKGNTALRNKVAPNSSKKLGLITQSRRTTAVQPILVARGRREKRGSRRVSSRRRSRRRSRSGSYRSKRSRSRR